MQLNIAVRNESPHPLPAYATAGSSGMDVRAWLLEPIELQPLERVLVPTGLFVAIPQGYEIQIRPRSGLAYKQGITCLNTPGTIDADYRGEVKVLLINLDKQPHVIHDGDRIAQMVVQSVTQISWAPTEVLDETLRSAGGFGSTGKN